MSSNYFIFNLQKKKRQQQQIYTMKLYKMCVRAEWNNNLIVTTTTHKTQYHLATK